MTPIVFGAVLNLKSIMTHLYIFQKELVGELAPPTMWYFVPMILFKRNPKDAFLSKICVGGRGFLKCGNLTLFHMNYSINLSHYGLSLIVVTWEGY